MNDLSINVTKSRYFHAGNILTIPELDSVIAIEIKTLITQLELYDEHALFLAANTAIQSDENLKRFYTKKRSKGKHHFSALNAVAAKLLRIVYWVLKNNKEYPTQLN